MAFAALALIGLLFLPKSGGVARWVLRWALAAGVVAFLFGVIEAGGLAEAWEEVFEEVPLGLHALAATLLFLGLGTAVWLGWKDDPGHLSRGERTAVFLGFLLAAATGWLGGEYALFEEREEGEEREEAEEGSLSGWEESSGEIPVFTGVGGANPKDTRRARAG